MHAGSVIPALRSARRVRFLFVVMMTLYRWAARFIRCESSDSIMWTVKFRNGNMKRFKFPIRTTAEGAANAYVGQKGASLDDECLLLEKRIFLPRRYDG